MKYEIVELEEKMVVGVSIRTSNQNGKAIQDIGLAWQKLFQKGNYDQIPNKVNGKTIGLYTDYEGDYTKPYRFFAGVEVRHSKRKICQISYYRRCAKFCWTSMARNLGDELEKNLSRRF